MTIDEALKLQEELQGLLPKVGFNKYLASNRIGIEALERVKDSRVQRLADFINLLPGETK